MSILAPAPEPIPGVSYHAQEQAFERHGIVADKAEWLTAVMSILDGRALLVRTCGDVGRYQVQSVVYAIWVGGQAVEVVWRVDLGLIATVLPPGTRAAETERVRHPTKIKKRPQEGWRNHGERAQFRGRLTMLREGDEA